MHASQVKSFLLSRHAVHHQTLVAKECITVQQYWMLHQVLHVCSHAQLVADHMIELFSEVRVRQHEIADILTPK